MLRSVYERTLLIDTSAVVALFEPGDRYHPEAQSYWATREEFRWTAVNVTAHEAFTRGRYGKGYERGRRHFDFLRSQQVDVLNFEKSDEQEALALLQKYQEHRISFHDALCAAVMKRIGIYRVFSFDKDFWIFGFEVLPGSVRP